MERQLINTKEHAKQTEIALDKQRVETAESKR